MRARRMTAAMVLLALPWSFASQHALAQLGMYTLPKDDFVWNWGKAAEETRHGFPDLDIRGSEAGFNCELTASLRPSSSLSSGEINDLENDLRTRMDFIYAVSETMNYLDRAFALDWATLDCDRPDPAPVDEAERLERETRARDKMQREIERRRERERGSSAE